MAAIVYFVITTLMLTYIESLAIMPTEANRGGSKYNVVPDKSLDDISVQKVPKNTIPGDAQRRAQGLNEGFEGLGAARQRMTKWTRNPRGDQTVRGGVKKLLGAFGAGVMVTASLATEGNQEFLVFKPSVPDLYLTVIPNQMYYGIEKKCANWLDNCSIRGIRDRLLQAYRGPI